MKKINENKIGLQIPQEIMEIVNLNNKITVKATEEVILIKNTEMTALEVINTIETLEEMVINLYEALIENCNNCEEEECCCDIENMEESIKVPEWALEEAGLHRDTKLYICVEENGERIILEPEDYKKDISDVDKEMLERLQDMGICMSELNEVIKNEYIIYEE